MIRSSYSFLTEPKDDLYRDLLALSLKECAYFQLVLRFDWSLNINGKKALESLSPFLKGKLTVSEWPGTILHGQTAQLLRFILNKRSVQVLGELTSSLYSWVYPDLPEDLSLIREDDLPWLVTISHDTDSYLYLSEEEFHSLTRENPRFRIVLKQDEAS